MKVKELLKKVSGSSGCPCRYAALGFEQPGVEALFFDGPEYQGHTTRVFAYIGFPEGACAEHPVPGVVLIHGGGATALADWVRLWNARGFAAIAMDNCGGVPSWSENPYCRKEGWPRHAYSGPSGWGGLASSGLPYHEQWMFHAVSSALNARHLLAAFPEVDEEQIGWTGISWGAVIGCIASGVEKRFRFAIPVYGCGFFNTAESAVFETGESELQRDAWFQIWDPAHYLAEAAMPFLWVTGTEDPAFPLSCWLKSSKLPIGTNCCSLRTDYIHDHTQSWSSKTIFDFARSIVTGRWLPRFSSPEISAGRFCISLLPGREICSATLCFTCASGAWRDRRWHTLSAEVNAREISAELPILTQAAFLQCFDNNRCLWSSAVLTL